MTKIARVSFLIDSAQQKTGYSAEVRYTSGYHPGDIIGAQTPANSLL